MFCSSAQHGREKKRDIFVAEMTRESRSPIQPVQKKTVDASAAEAILSSSELVTRLRATRLRSKMAIPECIAPGDRERGASFFFRGLGETGYGCHTFYITDVFRNVVIIADIRLLLCLNIVSCAHINMQFVIFNS